MKTTTTAATRRRNLLLTTLASALMLVAPTASAAVSLAPNDNNPDDCVLFSGGWESGNAPYDGFLFHDAHRYSVDLSGQGDSVQLSLYSGGQAKDIYFFYDGLRDVGDAMSGVFLDGNVYVIMAEYMLDDNNNAVWSGTYEIRKPDCAHESVPEGGSAMVLFAVGFACVGGVRRMAKNRGGC